MIKIYDTMTRSLRDFVPLEEGKVKMYVCGPTVYNYIHIGNARSVVAFDTIRRYFEYRGFNVTYISNFTDVDDKIIKAAKEAGMTTKELSDTFIAAFKEDVAKLGVKAATQHPRVIDYMDEIIDFVQVLIDKGYAYRRLAMSISGWKRLKTMPNWPIKPCLTWRLGLLVGSRVKVSSRNTPLTLPSGNPPNQAKCPGKALGARADLAGISSAQSWQPRFWEIPSTFTVAELTLSSLTIPMKSPNPNARQARPLPTTGCTMPCSISTIRRCPSPWAIS